MREAGACTKLRAQMARSSKPRVGISACLLGRKVRWDGRDKRATAILASLGPAVSWIPVCPELELGLGVPREPIQLVGNPGSPRLLGVESGADHTREMRRWAERRIAELTALGLDGWIAKRGSPSCGLRRLPVHGEGGGAARRSGRGAFVGLLRERLPDLPIEEEGTLEDPAARRHFLARVRAHRLARATTPPASRRRG